jgi:hypothetical protein
MFLILSFARISTSPQRGKKEKRKKKKEEEEISRYSSHYGARLGTHPNHLVVNLLGLPDNRRLRRHLPNDLPFRFQL